MAAKTYRATAPGYIDGRVIAEGEVFTTEFKEIVRDGKGAIERNKDGSAVTRPAKSLPTWVELAGKESSLERMVADAADPAEPGDPNLEEMDKAALQAMAAERNVQFTARTSEADLRTAIRAAADLTR
jgi:hypothetical protein